LQSGQNLNTETTGSCLKSTDLTSYHLKNKTIFWKTSSNPELGSFPELCIVLKSSQKGLDKCQETVAFKEERLLATFPGAKC
jgi:hypothetical protein